MSAELMGIPIERLHDPIVDALGRYESQVDGLVVDTAKAGRLLLTPEKPNSARSATAVMFKEAEIGTLYVIAFKPGDGTGSELSQRLSDLIVAETYPRDVRVVPRAKTGVYCEGHLAIISHKIENVHAEPILFGNKLDLLGIKGTKVVKIGQLGQLGQQNLEPVTTLTVGYHESRRFGDPHAVFSSVPDEIQVSAFLAISDAVQKRYPNILESLKPQLPFV